MNLDEFIDRYTSHPAVLGVSNALKADPTAKMSIEGVRGSLRALLAAKAFEKHPTSQLHILSNKESAQYYQNDLATFLGKKRVWLFPSPYKHEGSPDRTDASLILERTEVLNVAKAGEKHIIVTYPEALLEKVISTETLKANTLGVKVGDTLDIDFLIEFMADYGFERVDFVYSPGTFSLRGAIIDVYSFAHDLPYRLQMDEDKVESIRAFDPETQLSARKMNEVTLVPNLEAAGGKDARVSLLSYMADNTVVWAHDLPYTLDALAHLHETIEKEKEPVLYEGDEEVPHKKGKVAPIQEDDLTPRLAPEAYLGVKEFKEELKKHGIVEWSTKKAFAKEDGLRLEIGPQPDFNRNFDLIAQTLNDYEAKGYTNLIFSDQVKQIERLYAIFEDGKLKANFIPIYTPIHEGFIDHHLKLVCLTEHAVFGRYQRYKTRRPSRNATLTLKELYELKPGDYVTHIDYGVGLFSGLEKIDVGGKVQEAIRLKYRGGDLLYVNIHSLHKISRFVGQEGKPPRMHKLGSGVWESLKSRTKTQVKDIARDLIKLYAQRKSVTGFAFHPDTYLQTELEASFLYEDTPDQAKTTEEVKADMEKPHPMDRLVCGDVGFGKTEIAIRAAFKAVADSKQVAILVPTTVLALQHYKTFRNRLADFPATVDFISRFKSAAAQKETLKKVEEGKVDILIGTHRILSKDLKFKDLGLLIIDEEQKFGVAAKERLRTFRANVDTLTLTATPIPRTLQFSLMGARDMSMINTPPPNRQPVETRIEVFNREVIREALEREITRGGQVYFVHNRIKSLQDVGDMVRSLVPGAKVAVAHAQMEPGPLEEIMVNFIDGFYDVLVSTNIVESGLDIPNANTIVIDHAHNFGLSDLYQLRGRVGRSNRKAYCYLLTAPLSTLTDEARKRLAALEEHTDLGSGFLIAMKDMDIRGAGNLLGAEQSGFIAEIGLEMYHKILQEAMHELKEDEFKDLFAGERPSTVRETTVETDLELMIPDKYVTSVNERIGLYSAINDLDSEEALEAFTNGLEDRFGTIPHQTRELLNIVRIKWLLQSLNIDKASLKRGRLKATFSRRAPTGFYESEPFNKLINFVQNHPKRCKLEPGPNESLSLSIFEIPTAKAALTVLNEMLT